MLLNNKWFIGSGAAAALLAGSIYGGTALVHAQSASPSAPPNASARAAAVQQAEQGFIQHLATRLNISPDAAQTALKGAAKDNVADEVKAGKLTQAQADKIDANIDNGKFGPGLFGARGLAGPRDGFGFGGGQVIDAAATALNLKPADLMQQLRSGKTLQQIAQAQNVNFSTVQTAITNAVKPQLDKAVAAGKMTAQQETDALSRITSGTFTFPKGDGPHGRGHEPSPTPSASAQP